MLFKETELAAGIRRIDKKPEEVISKILNNGDIIIVQSSKDVNGKFKYPTALDYYRFLLQRLVVQFQCLNNAKDTQVLSFSMELKTTSKYDDIAKVFIFFLSKINTK